MEWKKLGRESQAGPWVPSAMDCKKLGSVLMSRRKTMFVSGFAFAFLVCSIFLAFNYPDKMAINPILIQRQTWFHSMLRSRSPSSSVSFLSLIFINSNSTTSAKLDHEGSFPNGVSSHRTPEGDEPSAALKENSVGGKKTRAKSGKKGTSRGQQKVQGSDKNSTAARGLKNKNNTKGTLTHVWDQKNNTVTGIFHSTPATTEGEQIRASPTEVSVNGTKAGSIADKAQKLVSFVLNRGDKNGTNEASMGPSPKEPKPKEPCAEHAGLDLAKAGRECDIFHGRWVHDESYPYYPAGSCPSIDESFNCFRNMRPDNEYEKWRWQPNDCNIPRLNASDMLERLRGKRLVFVGDSLNRNMWESLVCILRHGVRDKKRVYEISGRHEFKTDGFYAFRYEDYNCSVEFVRAPFLVEEWEMPAGNGTTKETLRLDLMASFAPKYKEADVIVFNTGHWWSHEKTSLGKDYYQEGDHVYPELNVLEAFRKALRTWGRWLDNNIDPTKTLVFFRGYSPSHFSGGQWNSGGQCHAESQPIFNDSYLTKYPPKMDVLESVINEIKTPVIYLNVTRLSDYRKDGHPSIYRKQYLSEEENMAPEKYQDCSHWCLPGVPDTWNELLYASLLPTGRGVWAK